MTYQVSPAYLKYLDDERKGRVRTKSWQFWKPGPPANPFGTGKGFKFEDMYDELDDNDFRRNTGPFQFEYDLPIQGPPNWEQLWPNQSMVGTDCQLANAKGLPLPDKQLRYVSKEIPGQLWRNIQFVRHLGSGSYGVVWEVSADKQTGSVKWETVQLACKVMRFNPNKADYKKKVETMLADMYQLRYLKHDNIVQFVDIIGVPDSQTGFPYSSLLVLMDMCDNDLFEQMKKSGPLLEQQTIECLRQISSGLRYLHVDQCMVHLDIKPGNILYSTNGGKPVDQWQYKLADFGTAIVYPDRQSMESQIRCGTIIFMAPEMNMGGGQMLSTRKCDIYSLGATVACCLLGCRMYRPNTFMAELPNKRPRISTKLICLIQNLTRQKPVHRPEIENVCNLVYQL
ncbi:uncharacterized protein LOC128964944 [Oppia nitens]|uniref:uncharacterized protein LOC128964944 n=1 Tax=Oppia nitens TaxID=1686743 RepID=UPI0023DC5A77|nr:uncharacterized protein LOC128964944 [Oppia nitens]